MHLWLTILIVYALHAATVVYIAIMSRKAPDIALLWVLVVALLPVGGLLFYWLLDSTHKVTLLPVRRRMKAAERSYTEETFHQAEKTLKATPDERIKEIVQFHCANGFYYADGCESIVFFDGYTLFSKMFDDIANAKLTIQIEFFMFRAGHDLGKKMIHALAEKAREGVHVCLLYDRLGDPKTHYKDFQELLDAGAEVEQYMPTFFSMLTHSNFRLHRKIVVIDSAIAYTGGINVGDEYVSRGSNLTPWRDTSVRITGPAVPALQARFLSDLQYTELQKAKRKRLSVMTAEEMHTRQTLKQEPTGSTGVQIVSGGPNISEKTIEDSYIKIITSAKKYVYIQSPYFIPGKTFRLALRLAAKSGVDVRLMLPGKPDHKSVYNLTQCCARSMLGYGIKVYLYKGFLHSKMIVSDDAVVSVGSANTDLISFHLNYEVGALLYGEKIAAICREAFFRDIKDCALIPENTPKGFKYWAYRKISEFF